MILLIYESSQMIKIISDAFRIDIESINAKILIKNRFEKNIPKFYRPYHNY